MGKNESLVDPLAVCYSEQLGPGARVAEFGVIRPGAIVGAGSAISASVFLGDGVEIGSRVRVGQGSSIDGNVLVEDDVFIGPRVAFAVDLESSDLPRSTGVVRTILRTGCQIGAGSTILPGVEIGVEAFVKPGSVVFDDVPDFAEVSGNPSTIQGYRHNGLIQRNGDVSIASSRELQELSVSEATLVALKAATDGRGSLVAGQNLQEVPFDVRRFFLVFGVPNRESRGAHAHRECHQFLVAVSGSVNVIVSDGFVSDEIVLDDPSIGLYMPPMIWGIQYKYTAEATLLVLASHEYDPQDYIRNYSRFVAEKLAADK